MSATIAPRLGVRRVNPFRRGNRPSGAGRRSNPPGTSSWWALLFVGPTALGLGVFYIWPTFRVIYMSFTKTGPFGGAKWVGIQNYTKLMADPEILGALRNTALFAVIALVGIPLAIVIAALLNTAGLRGRGVYRTLFFIPVITMPAAVGLVWRMIYNGEYGILNQVLGVFGIEGRSWLTDPQTALVCIALVGIWASLGTNVVIFLAGLQGIPPSLMEAAELDGAGPIRRFWSVTLPLLSPSIFFVSVIGMISALQVFDLVYMMLGRNNPALPEIRTIVYLFYEAGFIENQRGYAAAIAVLLLCIILVITFIQFQLQKKWVHYE